jgi:hypothetical protein
VAGSKRACPSNCRVSGTRARKIATSSGATAIQDSPYIPGSGKITTCRTADTSASPQALRWILSTHQNSKRNSIRRKRVRERQPNRAASDSHGHVTATILHTDGKDIPIKRIE